MASISATITAFQYGIIPSQNSATVNNQLNLNASGQTSLFTSNNNNINTNGASIINSNCTNFISSVSLSPSSTISFNHPTNLQSISSNKFNFDSNEIQQQQQQINNSNLNQSSTEKQLDLLEEKSSVNLLEISNNNNNNIHCYDKNMSNNTEQCRKEKLNQTIEFIKEEYSSSSPVSLNEESPKKKRRRGENERLMEDLSNDSSFAVSLKKLNQQKLTNDKTDSSTLLKVVKSEDDDSETKSNCTKLRLRPRNSCKNPANQNGAFIYDNKYSKQFKSKYTNETNYKSEPDLDSDSDSDSELEINEITRSVNLLSLVKKNIDVSVFANFIAPNKLNVNNYYEYHYISLKIVNMKPLRFVEMINTNGKNYHCPVLELTTVDNNERFTYDYLKEFFEIVNDESLAKLAVYLVGSYALNCKNLISKNKIINLLRFRTSNHLKKRRSIRNYGFSIIVDSVTDLDKLSGQKIESNQNNNNNNNINSSCNLSDSFLEIYKDTLNENNINIKNWRPAIIFTDKWLPPSNIREINRSLYIMQPCWDIYESSSKTIKMKK